MAEPSVLRKVPITDEDLSLSPSSESPPVLNRTPSYEAYQILHLGFTLAPLIAGIDKFTDILVNWDQYLAPIVPRTLGIQAHPFMMIVGVVEIIAGLGVLLKPKIFSYVVAAWLAGIIVNLLIRGDFYDVAL